MAIEFKKTNFTRNLAKRHKLVQYLERGVKMDVPWEFTYAPKEKDDGWHPSGHCTPPPSVLYNLVRSTHEEDYSGLAKAFAVGHFWHQYLQHVLVHRLEMVPESAIEVKGSRVWGPKLELDTRDPDRAVAYGAPYHYMTGSADVAPLEMKGFNGVVDFKTMGSHQFKKNEMPFADKYECQINIYMDFFDLDEGLIVAVCKDSPHEMKEFYLKRNQPLIDAIYEKLEFVSDCLDADQEPDGQDDEYFSVAEYVRGPEV